jgi:hypothetical protein
MVPLSRCNLSILSLCHQGGETQLIFSQGCESSRTCVVLHQQFFTPFTDDKGLKQYLTLTVLLSITTNQYTWQGRPKMKEKMDRLKPQGATPPFR